ncbi:macrophage mannose receptor 1-like [Garra rufa]|uniref:macrophage mannose receptor 1-like n=1 Tax=Garra rufa TaxID=137080 RepID=UPI003CCEB18F
MSWPEAQSYCRSRYTDLATVDSMGDVNRLRNIADAGYNGSVWIGLKRGKQKRWGWSNGQNTTSQYYNWALGQPNEGSYCRQYYTDLPAIPTSVANNQITKILLPGWYIWIGLFMDTWEWSDKWMLFFRHWAAGQLSESLESGDCVGMSRTNSGRWAQYSCDLQQPFICHGGEPSIPTYEFVNQNMTWVDAVRYCRARFTEMAAVVTMNDVRRLVNSVDPGYSGSAWIGLYSPGVKRWIWSIGDPNSQNGMWSPGEPNGDGECVRSFNGSWYDESCSSVLPFVCFNESTGFIVTETAMTWRDAQSYCRQHHTDLVSISSPEQQKRIPNELSLWIGLFLDSWAWANQWNHYFRYWAADQRSMISGSGNCVGMSTNYSGKWAKYICDMRQPFICYGNDKLIKKQTIRVKLTCNGKCTLNDPSLQTTILNEISKKLRSMGLESDKKLSWKKGEGGEVFHQEIKHRPSSNNACTKQ